MKAMIFSKVPIFPTWGGNRSRIKTFCEELKNLGFEVIFCLLPARDRGEYDYRAHMDYFSPANYHVLERHSLLSVPFLIRTLLNREMKNFYWRIFGKDLKSNNIDYRLDTYLISPIKNIIKMHNPDLLVVEYVHFSKIMELAPVGCLSAVDTHDSFSHEFTPAAERKGLKRANVVIAIQDDEASKFRQLTGSDENVVVISHLVPEMSYIDTRNCQGYAFVGSDFDANNVSLQWLYEKVLPIVVKARPQSKLFVAGTVCDAIPNDKNVVKMGKVSNLREIYDKAPILANSIIKGTGVKIKLLEALAMGVPVVSTDLGVVGIKPSFLGGVDIVTDNNAAIFALKIIQLYDDAKARNDAGCLGMTAIKKWNLEQRKIMKSTFVLSRTR